MTDPGDEELPLLNSPPFPWLQFSIIFSVKTAEFLTSTTTHPFIPDLIRHIGITDGEKDVGHYVGLLLSTFFAAETITTFYFSQLSDLIGRKPVLLACVFALSISISGFGLSTTFWILIIWQAITGALNGTMGVAKSMLMEATDSPHLARAIGYFGTSAYIASTIGSKIGGSLARPAEQSPTLFGSNEFLKKHPYFLPCAVCSLLLLTTCLAGITLLKETVTKPLPLSGLFIKQETEPEDAQEDADEPTPTPTRKPQPLRAILIPQVAIATINLAGLALTDRFYIAAQALFLSTPIDDGGLGLSVSAIGTFASASGIVVGISQVALFAPIHARLGSKHLFILGLSAAIPRFALWPAMNGMARRGGHAGAICWFALALQMCCSAFVQFAYGTYVAR
ncbi:hypothetical protein AX14_013516 [Amanita brunnescens Koide BX004]|nr:hypothetical protein AX14_013516 [Amanita brunnescens Koide BX004]